jgi:hypothetical protein
MTPTRLRSPFGQPVVPIEAPPEEPKGCDIFADLSGIGGWMG